MSENWEKQQSFYVDQKIVAIFHWQVGVVAMILQLHTQREK